MMRIPVLLTVVVLALAAAAFAGPTPPLQEVKASLAGTVLADGLVEVGAQVQEDQPLVYVRTGLTQRTDIAARSRWKGVVREVLVRPGQRVELGDVLLRIEVR
ncbi:MAG TPA: biotin/lipoyl-containing protein [bacterium]